MPEAKDRQRDLLGAGLQQLGIQAEPRDQDALMAYLDLVRKWTRTYNLVSARDCAALVTRHLLDSLSIMPYMRPGRWLDVGCGAGFPGVPLAILNPQTEVMLLDSAGKKVRFLNHVKRTLGLDNIVPVHERVESYNPGLGFSTITARAFSTLTAFAESCRHLAGPETHLLAMKGKHPGTEAAALPEWAVVKAIETLAVPKLPAQRHLVIMTVAN